jgi:hypothetical protein
MNWSARGNVLNQYLRNTSIGTTVNYINLGKRNGVLVASLRVCEFGIGVAKFVSHDFWSWRSRDWKNKFTIQVRTSGQYYLLKIRSELSYLPSLDSQKLCNCCCYGVSTWRMKIKSTEIQPKYPPYWNVILAIAKTVARLREEIQSLPLTIKIQELTKFSMLVHFKLQ